MRTVYLTFPRMNVSLEAPEEVIEKASLFYPYNIQIEKPRLLAHKYRVEREGNEWILQKDGESSDPVQSDLEATFRLEFDIETTLVQHCENWLAIHAGCVAVGEQACMIAGKPDTGKTTTTFHLIELGHKFMCEEIAFLDAETREVHPFLQTLSLESSFIKVLEPHFSIERGHISPLTPTLVRYSTENISKSPLKLSTILVPERNTEAEFEIIPLKPGEFLTEFLGYCFEPNVNMENFLDKVIAALEQSQIFRLIFRDVIDCREGLLRLFPVTPSE